MGSLPQADRAEPKATQNQADQPDNKQVAHGGMQLVTFQPWAIVRHHAPE
jgi:hypothetical protein